MWKFIRRPEIVSSLCLLGCTMQSGLQASQVTIYSESGDLLSNLPPVSRLHLSGLPEVPMGDYWLIRGKISTASQEKIRRFEIPVAIGEGRVAMAAWREADEVILAPSKILEPSEKYSLIALGVGLLGQIEISGEKREILHQWGPREVSAGDDAVYCVHKGPYFHSEPGFDSLLLSEFPADEEIVPGIGGQGFADDICVSLHVESNERDFFVPPRSLADWLIEPTALPIVPRSKGESVSRETMECDGQSFDGGCVVYHAAALEFRFSPGTYIIQMEPTGGQGAEENVVEPQYLLVNTQVSARQNWGPVLPDTKYRVHSMRLDARTKETSSPVKFEIETAQAEPRFVLTEVLADPQGAEPASEWVEVTNVGTTMGSLEGLQIWDSAGGSELPAISLKPGEYGLIVRSDFVVGPDVIPAAQARAVIVDSIGNNGLRNSGEAVELRSASGDVLSMIPALSSAAGVSIARRGLFASDEDISFSQHPSPGSSPGWENFLDQTSASAAR